MTKTSVLESLVIASFVRGLSVRDVEATLAEALGDQAAISKSTVSSVCQQIKGEYEAWSRRRLDVITLDYLFLDASFFRMHPGSPAEPVLAAWGITTGGKPAFIGLNPGPPIDTGFPDATARPGRAGKASWRADPDDKSISGAVWPFMYPCGYVPNPLPSTHGCRAARAGR